MIHGVAIEVHEDIAQQIGNLIANLNAMVNHWQVGRLFAQFLGQGRQRIKYAIENLLCWLGADQVQFRFKHFEGRYQDFRVTGLEIKVRQVGQHAFKVGTLDHHVFLGAAAPARAFATEFVLVDRGVFFNAPGYAFQLGE